MADEQQPNPPAGGQQPTQQPQKAGGYGKRPMWQWLLIYLVVGAVVYFLIYLVFFGGSAGENGGIY